MVRYRYSKDYSNDCITVCDSKEELKTSFDSDICLSPMEDAITVVAELNRKECTIHELKQTLRDNYFTEEDIDYIISSALDNYEENQEWLKDSKKYLKTKYST